MAALQAAWSEKWLAHPASDTWLDGDKNEFCSGIVKMEMVPAVTLVVWWHLWGPGPLIMDSELEEVQPTFNINYLIEESEAGTGHTSSIWGDEDRAQNVIRIIFFGGASVDEKALSVL